MMVIEDAKRLWICWDSLCIYGKPSQHTHADLVIMVYAKAFLPLAPHSPRMLLFFCLQQQLLLPLLCTIYRITKGGLPPRLALDWPVNVLAPVQLNRKYYTHTVYIEIFVGKKYSLVLFTHKD